MDIGYILDKIMDGRFHHLKQVNDYLQTSYVQGICGVYTCNILYVPVNANHK